LVTWLLLFALGVLMPVLVYVVHYRNSMSKFREMSSPTAEFMADDDGFTLTSDRATTTPKWSATREVRRYNVLWLLLFSRAQFVTIPLHGLSEEMRAFVLGKIENSGGKVVV